MAKNNRCVFVDSNFFIALYNPQDTLNSKAVELTQKIKRGKPILFISNFIFLEVVTVLSQRAGRRAAMSLGEHLLEDRQLEIVHIDKRLNTISWEFFKEIKKKNISFVDCSTLATMNFEDIKYLLTFDQKDFSSLRKKFKFDFYTPSP